MKNNEKIQREQEVINYLAQRAQEVCDQETVRRNRSVTNVVGREQVFLEQFKAALREQFKAKLANPRVRLEKPKGRTQRILNVILSDLHFGSALDPREVGHRYGAVEEARRAAAICRQVALYKRQYRDETELFIHLLGDIFQGQLHDMRDGLPLAEQVASAIRILVQVLRFLAVEFPRGVKVRVAVGNHGRNTARHRDRATFQKWDAIEMHVYTALKEVAAFIPGVEVEIGYEPKYDFPLFGDFGFGTHGDTVLNVGSPNKNIDVAGLTKQINSINNARTAKGLKPYRLFIVGHVHIGSVINLPGGVTVITNGCLIPPDAYANSIGIFDTSCGQWMWESVEGHPVGDARFITVDDHTDQDESLDAIVKPFAGLNAPIEL